MWHLVAETQVKGWRNFFWIVLCTLPFLPVWIVCPAAYQSVKHPCLLFNKSLDFWTCTQSPCTRHLGPLFCIRRSTRIGDDSSFINFFRWMNVTFL